MEGILGSLIPLSFIGMLVLEHFFAARPLPKVRFWLLKGLLFFSFTGVVNAVLPAFVASALAGRTLLDLRWLGTLPGALLGALDNYASFPIWDLLFGTFRNPESFPEHYGFWQGASSRLGAMLIGRDVGEPDRA